ncbi:hypothetical protein YC2023_012559 [Brassica napus]
MTYTSVVQTTSNISDDSDDLLGLHSDVNHFGLYGNVQGKRVAKDFNIVTEAKGAGRAVVKSFPVTITNKKLEIRLLWAGKGTQALPQRGSYDFTPPKEDSPGGGTSIGAVVGAGFVVLTGGIYLRLKVILSRARARNHHSLSRFRNCLGYSHGERLPRLPRHRSAVSRREASTLCLDFEIGSVIPTANVSLDSLDSLDTDLLSHGEYLQLSLSISELARLFPQRTAPSTPSTPKSSIKKFLRLYCLESTSFLLLLLYLAFAVVLPHSLELELLLLPHSLEVVI